MDTFHAVISSKLLLQDLKFDIVYDNELSLTLQTIMENFQKGSLLLGQMGHFTQILHQQQHRNHAFCLNFSCRVHIIISRQMKWATYGIFKSFTVPQICFVPLHTVAAHSYFIFCLFIFLGFKSDTIRLCNEQTKFLFQRSFLFVANQMF